MKNADMPAMPSVHCTNDAVTGDMIPDQWAGLTKREHYAGLALMGLVAAWGQHDVTDAREIAEDAVTFADALLAELDKEAT